MPTLVTAGCRSGNALTERVRSYGWHRLVWFTLLCGLIVLPSLFAIRQFQSTGGYLFYSNAFDEPTYLSFDGARTGAALIHPAEYLVLGLHHLGVSGGYINLLFDILWPVVTVVIFRRLALAIGFSPLEAAVYPFAIVTIPVLFGYTNPYYAALYDANYHSRGLSWIALPQAYYPPFLRTPEPQLSLCVLALATYLGVRRQSLLIPFAVAPFVYAFVGIPYLFVVFALFTYQRTTAALPQPALRVLVAIAASYLATAAALRLAYSLLVSGSPAAELFVATRLPLLSGTGTAALIVYAAARSHLNPAHRTPA